MRKSFLIILIVALANLSIKAEGTAQKQIRLAVAGMSHGHISFILNRPDKDDFKLVGFYEPNKELVDNLSQKYQLQPDLVYAELTKMLDETQPEAVVAFGSIYDHLAFVEACAPRGIDVMVEKPLAVNMKHVKRMAELAEEYDIHLLTDYETSWYPTTARLLQSESQCIIQASWNWPFNRKDMEIYGTTGYIKADNKTDMRIRGEGMKSEKNQLITAEDVKVYEDPFVYFADVINGKTEVEPYSVYSLENNVRVVEILDAARQSAKKGKTINLK